MMGYCACHGRYGGYSDRHSANPPPISKRDMEIFKGFMNDPEIMRAMQQYRVVNSQYNTPYLGGSSKDGTEIYHDQRFAKRVADGLVKYDGRGGYDPRPFMNVHEAFEGALIRVKKLPYPPAHHFANIAEEHAVEAAGGNWGKHTAAMRPEIRLAESESGQGTPPNLLVQPNEGEGDKFWHQVTANEGRALPVGAGIADERLRAANTRPVEDAERLRALGQGGGYTRDSGVDRGVERQADGWPGEPDKGQGAMRFFLVRHGKTELNKGGATQADRIRGWSDVPLDETGKRQAKKLGKQLANSGIEILAHSNLTRTKDTAEDIAKTTGAELVSWPQGLRPWNVGIYTGTDSNAAHPELQRMAIESPDEAIPKGESFTQFKCRVFSGLGELFEKYRGKHIAVVTHHRVERLLHAWLDGGQKEDTSLDFNTMFSHGEDPANADVIAVDPAKLAAAAQTACRELERIGPEKYSQKDAGFHEDHGPPTPTHPEGSHCGVCRYFGGEGKCAQVVAKPNHIGSADGCFLFMPEEGTQEMRKKGNKTGGYGGMGATNWDERDGPGGAVTGAPPMGDQGGHRYVMPGSARGGYDPELPSSATGNQFAGANLPQTMYGSFSGQMPDVKEGGYIPANYAVGAGGPPKASKPTSVAKLPHMGGGGKVSIKAPSVKATPIHVHNLALGGAKHQLAGGHITKEQHDGIVASARAAINEHFKSKAGKAPLPKPPKPSESSAGASGGKGGMSGGVGLLPYPVSPYMDQDAPQAGGYGGLGSLDPNFASQGQGGGPMGGQKMPWQQ